MSSNGKEWEELMRITAMTKDEVQQMFDSACGQTGASFEESARLMRQLGSCGCSMAKMPMVTGCHNPNARPYTGPINKQGVKAFRHFQMPKRKHWKK